MPEYIKDTECSRDTPVIWGKLSDRSYGTGKRIKPNIDGKHATDYEKKIYLPELLPLEEYDLVIVLFSGGKDSTAAYFKLLELGVPKNKIELWHHDIDGKNKERRIYNHAAVTQRRPLRKHAVSAAAAYADQPAAAPLLAEAGKSLREVTAVHINIDPTEASELGEIIANSLKNGTSMLRGGA